MFAAACLSYLCCLFCRSKVCVLHKGKCFCCQIILLGKLSIFYVYVIRQKSLFTANYIFDLHTVTSLITHDRLLSCDHDSFHLLCICSCSSLTPFWCEISFTQEVSLVRSKHSTIKDIFLFKWNSLLSRCDHPEWDQRGLCDHFLTWRALKV